MEFFSYYQYFPGFAGLILLFTILLRLAYLKLNTLKKQPLLFFLAVILAILLSFLFYLLSKAAVAEYFFRASLKKNSVNEVYEYQRKAILTNPNIDRYRVRFSQTNLLIANSLLDKAKEASPEDKQAATKAIQASLEEAKAAVALNDKKASNWANLGAVYKNLLTIAENADTWSISAYQRAIVLEPLNADYHLEIGGIYYLLEKYDESISAFEEAKKLKPNWPNIYYNLAWAYYQRKDYGPAIANMEKTITLLNSQGSSEEITKANNDLELFRSVK